MSGRLRTGFDVLDRKLGGGLPAGSIVVLSADPASQAELFLYELTLTRGTLYLSLARSAEAVTDSIGNTPTETGDPTVRHISGEAPLESAGKLISALPETSNLIVDPVDVLETQESPPQFRRFLNDLQDQIIDTNSLAIIHCLDGRSVPPLRDTTEHFADVVFDLRTDVSGEEITNRLTIPKFRGGSPPTETIELDLSDTVSVESSSDTT